MHSAVVMFLCQQLHPNSRGLCAPYSCCLSLRPRVSSPGASVLVLRSGSVELAPLPQGAALGRVSIGLVRVCAHSQP